MFLNRTASKMAKLVLYKQDASPPSCAVMMVAQVLGLKLEYKEPALFKLEHKTSEFKKINPMGTIPVLQDGDFFLAESHAIIKYLVAKYGGQLARSLYPEEPALRATVDQRLFYDAGVLFVRLKVVALPTLLEGLPGPSQKHLADIEDGYATLEAYLTSSRYLAAEHLTIADISVGSTATALQPIHPLSDEKFPKTADWLARLNKEPCFQTVNAPGVALFGRLLSTFWTKNKAQ